VKSSDPRYKAAVSRAHDDLKRLGFQGVRDEVVQVIVAATLRDDSEQDPTKYGRHLRGVIERDK
jgi:hypothetical protein